MAKTTFAVFLTALVIGSYACDFGPLDQMENIPPQCLNISASVQQMTEQMSAGAKITDMSGIRNATLNALHTWCRGIIEPFPGCLVDLLKVAKCKDDDKFVEEMFKDVPEKMKSNLGLEYLPDELNHIINEITVADLKFYASALFVATKDQCLNVPAYLLSDVKFQKEMACIAAFGDEGTATIQEQGAKLLQINWLTHGNPLSTDDCMIISDVLDTVEGLFTQPSCQDFVSYSMRYFKHFEDLICPVKSTKNSGEATV